VTGRLRLVRVPAPHELRSITTTGPVEPRATRNTVGAGTSLDLVLQLASADEARLADEAGWACWWSSPRFSSGSSIKVHLWASDDTQGRRSLEAIRSRLEAACFLVQASGVPSTPGVVLRGERPLHARLGAALMGEAPGDHPVRFKVSDDLDTVEVEHRWRWPVQPCPSCRRRSHPLEVIDGKPTQDASFAIALGEAVFGGGCDPDDWSDFDAQCPACGHGFRPGGRTRSTPVRRSSP